MNSIKFSCEYQFMSAWNGIPAAIKEMSPFHSFKTKLIARVFHCPKALCSHGLAYVVFIIVELDFF